MLREIATVSALSLSGAALGQSQEPPQTQQVESEHRANNPVQPEQKPEDKQQSPTQAPGAPPANLSPIPEVHPVGTNGECCANAEKSNEEGTEFWPPLWGYRLKITDTLIAAFTGFLFFATIGLYLATRKLVTGAEDTAERQLRAYILSMKANLQDFDATPLVVITFKNTGQTPAYNVTLWARLEVDTFPPSVEPTPPPPGAAASSTGPIGSGVEFHLPERMEASLDDTTRASIENGSHAIYISGAIGYRDIFGKERSTKFCFIYGGDSGIHPQGSMAVYTNWNEAN